MIFVLKNSCFGQNAKTQRLLELADLVTRGRHRIYVEDEGDMHYLSWKAALPPELSDDWDLSLELSMELEALEPARYEIIVCETVQFDGRSTPPVLAVEEAARLGREPYRIFVENDGADRDFLLTFSNAQQKSKLEELEQENLLRFEHCGGIGELKKKVLAHVKKHQLFGLVCATVFDSDAPSPGTPSSQALAVEHCCADNGLQGFMLKRRAIENYLALDWMISWANSRPNRASRLKSVGCFKSFCQLNSEQKRHFHMKKGLSADNAAILAGSIKLYNGTDPAVLKNLQNGFGDDVGSEIYAQDWVKNSQSAQDQDAWDEVNSIVSKVMVLCR